MSGGVDFAIVGFHFGVEVAITEADRAADRKPKPGNARLSEELFRGDGDFVGDWNDREL
jgi:hypothetical protein